MNTEYYDLVAAIFSTARKDFSRSYSRWIKDKKNRRALGKMCEVYSFYRSQWCDDLSNGMGLAAWRQLLKDCGIKNTAAFTSWIEKVRLDYTLNNLYG